MAAVAASWSVSHIGSHMGCTYMKSSVFIMIIKALQWPALTVLQQLKTPSPIAEMYVNKQT